MNTVIITGNLGRDPEVRHTQSGKAVCTLAVAVSNGRDDTTWVDVVVWERQAEMCGQYLAKGKKVGVEGRLQNRSWEQDGQTRHKMEVVAFRVEFLSPKSDGGGERPQRGGYGGGGYTGGGSMKHQTRDDDDNLPF